ncbi:MotA/TolQ/ExbB proton channel family protein [Haliangium sp.]|uniref:MotA/TolQ/ExbB proton channel family protein n=1 Tax=Haliangium sp. TaxID=2663208 RepID=UPI003D0A7D69
MNFALLGAEWVLWLLVFLSILSVGVMIERLMFFRARRIDSAALANDVKKAVRAGDISGFRKRWQDRQAMAAQVAVRGLSEREHGPDAVSEAMNSEKARRRREHERYLIVLGTLGNNAPFIGLFGTVLGVIQAFRDLSVDSQAGAEVVMSGISEALVATAVGLLVAIPAVVTFNYFNRRVREASATTDDVAHSILAALYGEQHQDGGPRGASRGADDEGGAGKGGAGKGGAKEGTGKGGKSDKGQEAA